MYVLFALETCAWSLHRLFFPHLSYSQNSPTYFWACVLEPKILIFMGYLRAWHYIVTKQGTGQTKTAPLSLLPMSTWWKKINSRDCNWRKKRSFVLKMVSFSLPSLVISLAVSNSSRFWGELSSLLFSFKSHYFFLNT